MKSFQIPWQIRYCAERDPDGIVSFSGKSNAIHVESSLRMVLKDQEPHDFIKSEIFETTSLDGYEWLTYDQMFEICKKFSYSIHKIFPKRNLFAKLFRVDNL
jgi:hypothetical protein